MIHLETTDRAQATEGRDRILERLTAAALLIHGVELRITDETQRAFLHEAVEEIRGATADVRRMADERVEDPEVIILD